MARRHDPNAELRQRAELLRRLADIRSYFHRRGIRGYSAVLTAVDPTLAKHTEAIGQWWTRPLHTLMPRHERVIAKMEAVIEHLNAE